MQSVLKWGGITLIAIFYVVIQLFKVKKKKTDIFQ